MELNDLCNDPGIPVLQRGIFMLNNTFVMSRLIEYAVMRLFNFARYTYTFIAVNIKAVHFYFNLQC